ncbi:hypothetical protein J1N09_01875 [Aureitalea sp. L0-47]|uniref:hypothetical protein n=1 Tax=Aureitalea sp. L0-47 TaxID=2816962 RepID=UPI0022374EB9|nr:hypothetical protein [Aureitalea sp. L0-47]MCW5518570.1 hypothetical protein [Aureitalea sp. L0-47]
MKVGLPILSLLFLLTSCQFFETEKISSETFYEQDIKTIDWNDVDQYPAFPNCTDLIDKEEQKRCFSDEIRNALSGIKNETAIGLDATFIDTIWVRLHVSETSKLSVTEIEMDSLLTRYFPNFKSEVIRRIDSLQLVEPANKKGVPVKTEFSLPIVIQTQ